MEPLENLPMKSINDHLSESHKKRAVETLEGGKILFFPSLEFELKDQERAFLSPGTLKPKSKNISYDIHADRLGGTSLTGEAATLLKQMMKRFAVDSHQLISTLLPYATHAKQGRTSYRPVEASGRATSRRKDDTLIHVDAFPSTPVKGNRILRVFANINPHGKPRVWRVGEPFQDVVKHITPRVRKPNAMLNRLLHLVRLTKEFRTDYDDYMLKMHNLMKEDDHYQKRVPQQVLELPAGSSWIVFTDLVSHAALSGQYVLEQTFYIPVAAMDDPGKSPLRILEKQLNRKLAAAHS